MPSLQPPIADIAGIGAAYGAPQTVARYVEDRFSSELMRLLHERQVRAVDDVLRAVQPRNALEVAPGPGRITRDVNPVGRLVCLEYNESMISAGRSCCDQRVQWVQGNAFELPFAANEFDFAYSFRFVRHFRYPDRRRLYAELHRVLSPGAFLVLDAVNQAVSGPLRAAQPQDYPIYDKLYRDPTELRRELSDAGFAIVRLDPVQRWFRWQFQAQIWLGPRSRRCCRLAVRLLEHLRRGPSLEWIVTARKVNEVKAPR
ncbi:MAG: methyltransferase domain-containing protein [Planctomycetales bacterium]|nr:methyltransferase domain-containing protein [Planctomycetales bacterium]